MVGCIKRVLEVLVIYMNSKHHYEIVPGDLNLAGVASASIKRQLQALNIEREIIRRVAIATYEAEINIVIHSYGGYCAFTIINDYLQVIFKDRGPGILSIEYAMREGTSTAPHYAVENGFGAGMGLPNIKKVSDDFSISSSAKGTIVEIGFHLKKHES